MKILHMIRNRGDVFPMDIAAAQKAGGDDVKVVLIQDAVFSCVCDPSSFCCKEDAEARGVGCGNQVDYKDIVKMVFDSDSVVNW